MINLNICDSTLSGRVIQQFLLPIATSIISARELIVEQRFGFGRGNQGIAMGG